MQNKIRLDLLLVQRNLARSTKEAQAIILAGQVKINTLQNYGNYLKFVKPGTVVSEDTELIVKALPRYVSRGGEKLEGALNDLKINVAGKVCLDVGASTGGFTDCLLQHGAIKIYAVDTGYGKLHPKLRSNPKVILFEKTHILNLNPESLLERPELAAIDVSFISLTRILDKVAGLLAKSGKILALIKPQFEVSAKMAPKGVVKSDAGRKQAIEKILNWAQQNGLQAEGSVVPSRLIGPKGNMEFWVLLKTHIEAHKNEN